MAFWDAKIACEQCTKKTKEKTALDRRGSKFCSQECIAANEAANPPPVATAIDSTDFMAHDTRALIATLVEVRKPL